MPQVPLRQCFWKMSNDERACKKKREREKQTRKKHKSSETPTGEGSRTDDYESTAPMLPTLPGKMAETVRLHWLYARDSRCAVHVATGFHRFSDVDDLVFGKFCEFLSTRPAAFPLGRALFTSSPFGSNKCRPERLFPGKWWAYCSRRCQMQWLRWAFAYTVFLRDRFDLHVATRKCGRIDVAEGWWGR